MRLRRSLTFLPAALIAALVLAAPASAGIILPESGGSPNANAISSLYVFVLVLGALVFIAVEGALFYALWKFKARKGAVAEQIHGNTRLEIGWTVGAGLILVVITIVTFVKLGGILDPADSDAANAAVATPAVESPRGQEPPPSGKSLPIKVDGQQYIWRYEYPGEVIAYYEMVVPVGTTVTLAITSTDVAHSWWIPKLGGKADALPGYTNQTWFKALKPGIYNGQCAELCGRNHANMTARVRAVPLPEYKTWLAAKRRELQRARRLSQQGPPGESPQTQSPSAGQSQPGSATP